MATAAGPLCEEPMWGVAFEVDVRLNVPAGGGEAAGGSGRELALQEEVYGPFSGQVGRLNVFNYGGLFQR